MNSPPQASEDGQGKVPSLQGDERWQLALRVAGSPGLQKAKRLRQFLLYLCEKTLTNQPNELREQLIGIEVFERPSNYNPAEDNIVRVEARELRRRLDIYFLTEGRAERTRIRIPKGSYLALFESNNRTEGPRVDEGTGAAQPHAAEGAALAGTGPLSPGRETGGQYPAAQHPPPSRDTGEGKPGGAFRRTHWGSLVLGIVIGVVLIIGLRGWRATKAAFTSAVPPWSNPGPPDSVWHELFPSSRPLAIVVADSSLVLAEEISGKVVSLTEYLKNEYISALQGPSLPVIIPRRYTDSVDAAVTSEILQSGITQGRRLSLLFPRDLKALDLEDNNLIFLGSSYSDPWINEFDAERDFVLAVGNYPGQLCYVDKSPRPGESSRYCSGGPDSATDETYGLISFLPNLRGSGNILFLEGTNSEGTEAAGDFIVEPHCQVVIRDLLQLKKGSRLPPFQLLLRTIELGSAPGKLQVVVSRILPASRS